MTSPSDTPAETTGYIQAEGDPKPARSTGEWSDVWAKHDTPAAPELIPAALAVNMAERSLEHYCDLGNAGQIEWNARAIARTIWGVFSRLRGDLGLPPYARGEFDENPPSEVYPASSTIPAAPDVGEIIERLSRDLELQDGGGVAYTAHDEVYTVVVQGEDLRAVLSALASSAAETARLREELADVKDELCKEEDVSRRWRSIAQATEAEKEAMRVEAMKVLEPFAKAARASSVMEGHSGDCYKLAQNGGRIAFMDLRKAASFCASLSLR